MAHRGRIYPVYNPARIFAGSAEWPFYFPTEYKWQVDGWFGPDHGGMAIAGRGMVPIEYDPAAPFRQWRVDIPPTLGPPLVLTLTVTLDPAFFGIQVVIDTAFDGVQQQQLIISPVTATGLDLWHWQLPIDPPPHGPNVWFGNFLQLGARSWRDPAPPPPFSSPF